MGLKQNSDSFTKFKFNEEKKLKDKFKIENDEKSENKIVKINFSSELESIFLKENIITLSLIKKFIKKLQNLTQFRNIKNITSTQLDLINDLSTDKKKILDNKSSFANQNPEQEVNKINLKIF